MRESMKRIDHEIAFLKEDDYGDKMLTLVRPVLEKHRKTGFFESFDGTKIYYEYYSSSQEKTAVVISHGFCEFTQKFEEVIYYFVQAGYPVYILDHRGHGYSERSVKDRCKVYINSYEEYVQDFHLFLTQIVLKDSLHKKLVLYAHSMGGAIAALYLEQHPGIFSCAILSSPMLEVNCGIIPSSVIWLVMLFKKLFKSEEDYVVGHGAFDGKQHFKSSCCLSEARYNYIFTKRMQDENYQTYGASCAWTLASLKAVRKLHKNSALVKTPILLFQAGKDTTVRPKGQRRFAKKSKDTLLVLIPASKHEIYNANSEIIEEYFHRIFEFIEEKVKY